MGNTSLRKLSLLSKLWFSRIKIDTLCIFVSVYNLNFISCLES